MEIVVATHQLESYGGTETYATTVASALEQLGHTVTLHAPRVGAAAADALVAGLRVTGEEAGLPTRCDAVLANTADVAYDLAARYPQAAHVSVCHSEVFELQVPPQLPGACSALVVLSDGMRDWALGLAEHAEVLRLRQPVDLLRFHPRGAPRARPRRALLLGNYVRGGRRAMIEAACIDAGIEPVLIGDDTEPTGRSQDAICDADLVIGKARVIVEAMACGRPAYVLDVAGGDGWVTGASYGALEADNFAGRATADVIDGERLRRDLCAWTPELGIQGRDLAVAHHSAVDHARELVRLFERVGPPAALPGADALGEHARLVRRQWRAESRALSAERELERLRTRIAALEDERASEADRASAAHERAAASDARVHELDAALRREEAAVLERDRLLAALRASRRHRVGEALARPVELLRGRRTR